MIISAKIIEHPRKIRTCPVCNLQMNFSQLRLFGAAEAGDPPFVVYVHVVCGKYDAGVARKLQAVEHPLHSDGGDSSAEITAEDESPYFAEEHT